MRRLIPGLLCLALITAAAPAGAQVTIDMSKLTCADYLAMAPDRSRMVSAWMSGWFNYKTGYVWIDLNHYAKNIANVKQWCTNHMGETVFVGLQRATGQ